MGNTLGSRRSDRLDPTTYSPERDIGDLSWLEAIERSFIFVWCDASIGTKSNIDDVINTITQLANVVNKNRQLVHTFNDLNTCREFIKHVNNVCLIISGSMGEELVPKIHNHEQIHSIYIFCLDKQKHELWSAPYQKVRGVFTDIRAICESLKSYTISQALIDYNEIEFDIINNDINSDNSKLSLIYSKLSKTILLNMNSSDRITQDMINYCRSEYKTDNQKQLIDDFEKNYSQHNPIWWYTRNCFFQGIINRALRTNDLYALCSMHRFIEDIDIKLEKLNNNSKSSNELTLNLYFGQLLSKDIFDKLKNNRGKLMCINQFLSANSEQSIAMMFLKQQTSSTSNKNKIHVLFQIQINQTKHPNVSYGNIGSISEFVHEKEYLISMSSIYRIDKIETLLNISSTWLVQLTLINQNDIEYNNLIQYVQEEHIQRDVNLGFFIKNRLEQFKLANKFFKQALFKNRQDFRLITLHYNMAIIYDALGAYDKSLNEYRYALNIARDLIPTCYQKDDLCLVPIYGNMALTYEENNLFNYALEHAFRALRIVLHIDIDLLLKKELESSCYVILGTIHNQEGKFDEAQNFYERALTIRQEYLPIGHPDITVLQRLITLLLAKYTTVF